MSGWAGHWFWPGRNGLFVGITRMPTAQSPYSDGFLPASPDSSRISISLAAFRYAMGFLPNLDALSVISVSVWGNG